VSWKASLVHARPNPYKLRELLEDCEKGEIQLPDFQRSWVWDEDRINITSLYQVTLRGKVVETITSSAAMHPPFIWPSLNRATGKPVDLGSDTDCEEDPAIEEGVDQD
jgi:hypothetical protein